MKFNYKLFIAFIITTTFTCSNLVNGQWTQTNGPYGGTILSLTISDNNIFAGANGVGIFRSTDNGAHWAETDNGLTEPFVQVMTNFSNGSGNPVILAGTVTGFNGIFRSTNNGESWTQANNGLTNLSIYSFTNYTDGSNNTYVFAGTMNGVYLSTNYGLNWVPKNTGTNPYIWSLTTVPDGSGGTYIFAGTHAGVYRSSNNGTNWTQVNNGLTIQVVYAFAVTPNGSGGYNIFAGTAGGGIFLSTNYGGNWTDVSTAGLSDGYIDAMTAIGTNVYAGTRSGGVFFTTDNGANWNAVNTGLTSLTVWSFAVSENYLFTGTDGGVFVTDNNNINWAKINEGLLAALTFGITASENGSGGTNLYAGTASCGMFRSSDNGENWTEINNGLTELYIYPLAIIQEGAGNSNIFAGTWYNGNGAFRSTDNGENWTQINNGLNNHYIKSFLVSGTALFAGTSGGIFRSTNNGDSWISVNNGLGNPNINSITKLNSDLIAGTWGGGVYRSIDNGANWMEINNGLGDLFVRAVAAYSDGSGGSYLFAGTYSGGIFRSTNNGMSWAAVNTGLTNLDIMSFAVHETIILAGTEDGVFISTNNGMNWTAVNEGLSLLTKHIRTLFINGENIYAGTAAGIWKRSLSEIGIPVELTSFTANVNENSVYLHWSTATETNNQGFEIERYKSSAERKVWERVGYVNGHGTTTEAQYYSYIDESLQPGKYQYRLKQIDYDGTYEYSPVVEVLVSIPDEFSLQQNYPNPFNPGTVISWQTPVSAWQTLKIYDVLGKEVVTLIDEYKPAGKYEVEFNAAKLTSGVYYYQLRAGNYTETKKMILAK